MSRDDVRKLLGGYATGTLTGAEQEALFAAALEDQELFDQLMKEQPVRDLLHDPSAKAELLAALDDSGRRAWWQWRPLIAGVAMAGIAAVAVVWVGTRPAAKPEMVIVAELKRPEPERAILPAAPEAAREKERAVAPRPSETRRDSFERAQAKQPAAAKSEARPEADMVTSNGDVRRRVEALPPPPARQAAASAAAPPPVIPAPPPAMDQAKAAESLPAVVPAPFRANTGSGGGGARSANQLGSQGQQGQQGFIAPAAQTQTVEVAATMALLADKKAESVLHWTILRGDTEIPATTLLNTGETVRLRIVAAESGTVSLVESEKVLVTLPVEASKPFDTPPIPFAGSGTRTLRVVFLRAPGSAGPPVTLPVLLRYR